MIIMDKLPLDNKINTLIFDIDGTITRWKNVKSFLENSLNELGIPYSDGDLEGLFKAMEFNEYNTLLTGIADEEVYSTLLEMYVESLGKYGVSGERLKEVMFDLEASETFISEETPKELEWLAEHYKLYCYTNWFYNQAIKKLDIYDLTKYFRGVHSPEDNFLKYSKVGFLYLMEKYHLSPEKTVHVGDSENDIVPSSRAGLHPIYLDYGIKTSDDITPNKMKLIHTADASITEFGDIKRVLIKK